MRIIVTVLLSCLFNVSFAVGLPKLQVGDLLFQDLNCGVLCDGVNQVTRGVDNTYISHVAMVSSVKQNHILVIEAVSEGVVETPLARFLARSRDANGHPRVIIERLKPQYQHLIPGAVKYARAQLGKPYNASFVPNKGKSFYCSELIFAAFSAANHGVPIFHEHAMSFDAPGTHHIESAWQSYFAKLNTNAPQGQIGTNPGMMSRESSLFIVEQLGTLRRH